MCFAHVYKFSQVKKATILFISLSNVIFISAQQELGVRNSNYAGIQSIGLNPSAIAGSRLKWDINVIATNTLYDNTFLFVPRDSLHVFGFKNIINDIINETQFLTHYD